MNFPQEKIESHPSGIFNSNKKMKVVRLDNFQPAYSDNKRERSREFSTVFVDESTVRRGGIGEVAKAYNAQGVHFALKTIPSGKENSASLKREFENEYSCHKDLSKLKGFPKLLGKATLEGSPVLLMEWIEGITLKQAQNALALDEAGRLSPLTAAQIGRDLFDLLSRLSLLDNTVVHRDISQNNVMIRTSYHTLKEQVERGDFDLVLIDFGSSSTQLPSSNSLTSSAIIRKGTADFAPPEMLSDDLKCLSSLRKSPAVDVFAAASVIYTLLSGHPPYDLTEAKEGLKSPYRIKMDSRPAAPQMLHERAENIDLVLKRETALEKELEKGTDLSLLKEAFASVDSQLESIILPCLESAQEKRPVATSIHDALGRFCDNYMNNLKSALSGEPITSCIKSRDHKTAKNQTPLTKILRILSIGVWTAVVVATGILSNSAQLALPSPINSFTLSGWSVSMILAIPSAASLFMYRRIKTKKKAYIASSINLAITSVAAACFLAAVCISSNLQAATIITAATTTAASCWLILTVKYAHQTSMQPPNQIDREQTT